MKIPKNCEVSRNTYLKRVNDGETEYRAMKKWYKYKGEWLTIDELLKKEETVDKQTFDRRMEEGWFDVIVALTYPIDKETKN